MSSRLRSTLKLSMLVTLLESLLVLAFGLLVYFYLFDLVDNYLDDLVKDLNATKTILNSYESIVPTVDDLPEEIEIKVGRWPEFTALVILGLGASMLLFSLFGIFASTSRNNGYILILVVVTMLCVIGQFLIFGCVVDLSCYINSGAKEKLLEMLHENYEVGAQTNGTFTFLMNSVMLMGECCGIEGPADFLRMGTLNFSYVTEEKPYDVPLLFPLACCNKSYTTKGFQATVECGKAKTVSNINNKGCYEQAYGYINDNYGRLMVAVFVLIITWEMMQICVGLVILFAPCKEEKEAVSQVLKASEMNDLQDCNSICDKGVKLKPKERMPVFVPVASVPSSDSKPDVSSQIW